MWAAVVVLHHERIHDGLGVFDTSNGPQWAINLPLHRLVNRSTFPVVVGDAVNGDDPVGAADPIERHLPAHTEPVGKRLSRQ